MSIPRGNILRAKPWSRRRRRPLLLFACVLQVAFVAVALRAQEKNPFSGDAKVAKLGESQFRANCAFCHGLGARGGGRGPDLTSAQKHHGNTDTEMFHNVHDGIPGTAMAAATERSEEHTSELQSLTNLVCRLLLEKKKKIPKQR